ncbi:hypothetical protein IEA70_003677, partial [Salmonella enterica]|nr:hypothetical protein [Salmonella enterica]EHN9207163.1 hypothetical protein [Salmonella enterica subsp. enterica serovar London]
MKARYKWLLMLGGYALICYLFLADLALSVKVPVSDVISNLIDLSAIFLAIVGMWVAYSYPAAISKVVNDNDDLSLITSYHSAKRLEALIMNILVASIVLISCLLLNAFIIPIVKSSDFFKEHSALTKQIGYCGIWFLCLIQVVMILQIVRANLSFLDDLDTLIIKLASQRKKN